MVPKYVPENMWQAEFKHYPKQQECIVLVMQQMEKNRVIPDRELGSILINTFGTWSDPYKRYCRMLFWMPKGL